VDAAHLFLQQWLYLSEPTAEEALCDSLAMRRFAGIDLGREPVPDEATGCRFRHLLETHDFCGRPFEEVHRLLPRELPPPRIYLSRSFLFGLDDRRG
jgi:IS5 family transposase